MAWGPGWFSPGWRSGRSAAQLQEWSPVLAGGPWAVRKPGPATVTAPPRAGVQCQQERGTRSSARSSGHDWPAKGRRSVLCAGRLQSRSKSWDQSVSSDYQAFIGPGRPHSNPLLPKGKCCKKKNKSVPSGGRLAERPRADLRSLRPLHDPAGDPGGLVLRHDLFLSCLLTVPGKCPTRVRRR